ncbi:MAG TPA: ATP-binding protein [Chitinophagales bacterium]|nr:ATP-binding protein [Chitinophagales bacterium]HNL85050.1 ATP-binding protein [Chitinophagales bacterium]
MVKIADLKISSRKENIVDVETLVESLRIQFELNDTKYHNMLLASVEAVNNAIEHGNNSDEDKNVYISAIRCETTLKLSIKDEGRGFNPDKLPDPTCGKFLEQPDGRGVFLIRQLADEVAFLDGGTRIEMKFRL